MVKVSVGLRVRVGAGVRVSEIATYIGLAIYMHDCHVYAYIIFPPYRPIVGSAEVGIERR